ncbi:MAG: ArsR family transcriptional regulator [Promethearchaeota archaeon]
MSRKESTSLHTGKVPIEVKNMAEITDPSIILVLFHEKKMELLKLLLEKDMNIQDLKKATGINPGTIKRHLDDPKSGLIHYGLVFLSKIEFSEANNIRMKFYRATAKKFKINLTFPDDLK